jgi:hypothetical protein
LSSESSLPPPIPDLDAQYLGAGAWQREQILGGLRCLRPQFLAEIRHSSIQVSAGHGIRMLLNVVSRLALVHRSSFGS